MGLTEVFCENVENMIEWMKGNGEEALENKDLISEYLISHYLTIQMLLGNSDPPEVILKRIKLEVDMKWHELRASLSCNREANFY